MTAFSGDTLVWDYAALDLYFRSPVTGVGRDLARRAVAVESQAKINASHPPPSTRGGGPAVQTGRLRASISWRFGEDEISMYVDIGTNVNYAQWLDGPDQVLDRPFLTTALAAAAL